MKTLKQIFNEITCQNVIVNKSLYFETDSKLLRVSDHLPSICSILNRNNQKNLFFVFVNSELNETEIQNNLSMLEDLGYNCDFSLINSDSDYDYAISYAKRFINS